MKRWLTLLLLLVPTFCFGQTAFRYDNIAIRGTNPLLALSNVRITVCSYPSTGNPCTTPVPTFTDATLNTTCPLGAQVVLSNTSTCTGTSDVAGNYGFWLASGTYTVTVTVPGGPGIINAITLQGLTNTTTSLKPTLPNDPIQYVSANGNDSNDGLSWGSAKLTVYKALQSLPGGSVSPPIAGAGTVLLSGTVKYGGPANSQGMWIMGSTDPNFASPPSGWLKWSNSQQGLSIECVHKSIVAANGHIPICTMNGGGTTDLVHPAVWLSGATGIQIKDVAFTNFLNTYVKLGIDSNNNRNGTGGVSGVTLDGVAWNHGACRFGGGPGIDIGSNSFWIWIKDIVGSGCLFGELTIAGVGVPGLSRTSGVATVNTTAVNSIAANDVVTIQNATDSTFNGSFSVASVNSTTQFTYNQAGPDVAASGSGQVVTGAKAAINIDSGTTGTGSGLIFVSNFNVNSGGIRLVPGTGGGGIYAENGTYEGDFTDPDMPGVLVTKYILTTNVHVENLEMADTLPASPVPGVQLDNGAGTTAVISRVDNGVKGGVTALLGGTPIYDPTFKGISALRNNYTGFTNGRITGGGIDVARRGFSPVAAIAVNLANQTPGSWTFRSGAGTITAGIAAPDGTTGAGRITSNAGQSAVNFYTLSNTALTIGDTYIYGMWQRSNSNGNLDSAGLFSLNATGGVGDLCAKSLNPTGSVLYSQTTGDGQWIWNAGICKIYANPTNAGIALDATVTNPQVIDVYGPILIKFAAGTKSDNELFEIANTLQTYSPSCTQGQLCTMSGPLTVP